MVLNCWKIKHLVDHQVVTMSIIWMVIHYIQFHVSEILITPTGVIGIYTDRYIVVMVIKAVLENCKCALI